MPDGRSGGARRVGKWMDGMHRLLSIAVVGAGLLAPATGQSQGR